MNKRLLFRLDRAIKCINADDPDKIFNENLAEVRMYARNLNKENSAIKEIYKITDGILLKAKHSPKEKQQIVNQLHSLQEKMMKQAF